MTESNSEPARKQVLPAMRDPARDLREWREASLAELQRLSSAGLGRERLLGSVFDLEALLCPASADPLLQIRNLRDAMAGEIDRLRRAGALEKAHDELHGIVQQVEGILCPPSAEHEAAVERQRERHAQHEAARIAARAKELTPGT